MNTVRTIIAPHLAVTTFVIGWALTPVFVRYMSGSYDPHSQAFIRYASAATALCAYSLVFLPEEFRKALRCWQTLLPMSLLVVFMQLAWTVAIYNTTATKAQLVTTIQAPLVILLSFLVFHEERAVIKSPRYLIGTCCCVIGVTGVFMRREHGSVALVVDLALMLLLFVSIAWAVYAVWGRHTAKDIHPVAMFTVLSVYVSLGFLLSMMLFGQPECLVQAGIRMNAIAFISGVICIAASHCAFHHAQVKLGSAYCTSIQLVSPFITHILALLFWMDEQLMWLQWAGGILLVAGSLLVIYARRTVDRSLAEIPSNQDRDC